MNPKSFTGLAAFTGIALVAALGASFWTANPPSRLASNDPAFPELRTAPNSVVRIEVESADGSFSLQRADNGRWTAPDRHNYRVDTSAVRDLVVALADMRLVEAKTAKADRYTRLEVEDVSDDEAASRRVRLEDADGAVLADAIIGKRHFGLTGQQPQGTYIRRANEAQSWLASGGVDVDQQLTDWLDDAILSVKRDEVRRVAMTPAAGDAYAAARETVDDPLVIVELPDGKELDENNPPDRLLSVMANLRLDDVAPRDDVDLGDAVHQTEVTTFDGLTLKAELAEVDDAHWARFVMAGDGDNIAGRLDGLKERLDGWVFEISQATFDRLTTPLGDWLVQDDDGTS